MLELVRYTLSDRSAALLCIFLLLESQQGSRQGAATPSKRNTTDVRAGAQRASLPTLATQNRR